jgi:hypothetical protein
LEDKMKKILSAVGFVLLLASFSWAQPIYQPGGGGSGTGVSTASECNAAAYYAIGKICQDTDDGKLYIGTGAAVAEVAYGANVTALKGLTATVNGVVGWTTGPIMAAITSMSFDDSAAQFYNAAAPTKLIRLDASGLTAGETAVIKPVGAYTLTYTLTGATGVTFPTTGTLSTLAGAETLSNKTVTGTSAKFTGDLTGLAPSVPIHIACNADDAGSSSATFHCATLAGVTNQLVGMTLYNTTDASSCTITANDDHTITCTLAGGTGNHWDSGNAMQVGPGPSQSGSFFYVDSAHTQTLRHPATAGYVACYMAEGTVQLDIDMASDSMGFVGTLDTAVVTEGAGHEIRSSASTTDDYICIHNRSTTVAKGLGKRGTWTAE